MRSCFKVDRLVNDRAGKKLGKWFGPRPRFRESSITPSGRRRNAFHLQQRTLPTTRCRMSNCVGGPLSQTWQLSTRLLISNTKVVGTKVVGCKWCFTAPWLCTGISFSIRLVVPTGLDEPWIWYHGCSYCHRQAWSSTVSLRSLVPSKILGKWSCLRWY